MSEIDDEMETKEVTFRDNPFSVIATKNVVIIGDLDKIVKLSNAGRTALKYVAATLNKFENTCNLVVQDMCMIEHDTHNETVATRMRRGIRNLIDKKVIAKTAIRNRYWVNKSVIWR